MTTDTTSPRTGAHAVIVNASDPARRADVFFRVRREPGQAMSSWVPVGAFVVVSLVVVGLMRFIPGGA
ncbi:UDP-N-acetylmuramyl pentapeptide phosphotransferase [Microbacterium sp. ZW T5_56]|uniref:UDP-N-acetylmuramyl pentapeptide phosphotransferase n=1 Tax=Microbacterium sp. ZW T5_56 TaxID=3378081 RepID=UPI0038518718